MKPSAQTSDPDLRAPEDIDDDEADAQRRAAIRLDRQIDEWDERQSHGYRPYDGYD